MKKIYFSFFLSFFLINISNAQKINIDEAYQIVLKNDSSITQKDVFYSLNPLNPNEKIINFKTVESPDYISWFFFVDEHPYQSWEHPCYYAFINCETGELKITKGSFPPKLSNMKVKVLQPMPPKGKLFDFKKKKKELKSVTTYDTTNDYAVIISGGYDNENNWYRYWNDCSAMYSALVDVYNYSPSHIYVIMSDGTSSGEDRVLTRTLDGQGGFNYTRDSSPLDLDGNGTNDIQYSATKSNISSVFNTLSGILDSEDNLFVFTTDHGGQTSGNDVYLYLWGQTMTDDEFATELDKVDAEKITVTMEQCHSGGFIDDLTANGRIISTACLATEQSHALANLTYNEYVYHWISAIAGETPEGVTVDADENNDGWVSMREAFDYAENADTQPDETPQYNSTPGDLGCFVRLSDNWNWNIYGPSLICNSGSFSVNDVPTGAIVTWEDCSPTLTAPSNTHSNPGVFTKSSNGTGWVEASINNACGSLILPRKNNVWVGKPSFSGIELGVIFTDPPHDEACINQMITLGVTNSNAGAQGVLGYHWQFGSWGPYFMGYEIIGSAYFNSLALLMLDDYAPETQIVGVSAENTCGIGCPQSKTFYAVDCGGGWYMSMHPNPASDYVTVSFVTNDEVRSEEGKVMIEDKDYRDKELKEYTIEIWDEKRGVVKRVTSIEKYLQIPVNDLAPGRYYFHLIYNGQTYKQQLIVE